MGTDDRSATRSLGGEVHRDHDDDDDDSGGGSALRGRRSLQRASSTRAMDSRAAHRLLSMSVEGGMPQMAGEGGWPVRGTRLRWPLHACVYVCVCV